MNYFIDRSFTVYPETNFIYFLYENYDSLTSRLDTIWDGEDVHGRSLSTLCISKLYASYFLAIMIKLEKDIGVNTDDEYYEEKYNLSSVREKLACCNIEWDSILSNIIIVTGMPRYFGTLPTRTPSKGDIQSLDSDNAQGNDKTWYQDGNGEYIYYCYPQLFGTSTFFTNGFLNTAWTLSTMNIDGVIYNIYIKTNIQHGTNILIKAD